MDKGKGSRNSNKRDQGAINQPASKEKRISPASKSNQRDQSKSTISRKDDQTSSRLQTKARKDPASSRQSKSRESNQNGRRGLDARDDKRSKSRTPIKIPQVTDDDEAANEGKRSRVSRKSRATKDSRASSKAPTETEGDSTSVWDDDTDTETDWNSGREKGRSEPASQRSRYSSSMNDDASSIQTPRSYVSRRSNESSSRAPSKKSLATPGKESPLTISRKNSYSDPSGRENSNRSRLTRDGSHISNRNNSRWSQYSEGGYSISSRKSRNSQGQTRDNDRSTPGSRKTPGNQSRQRSDSRKTNSPGNRKTPRNQSRQRSDSRKTGTPGTRVQSREPRPWNAHKLRKSQSEKPLRKGDVVEEDEKRKRKATVYRPRISRRKSEPAAKKQFETPTRGRQGSKSRTNTGKAEPVVKRKRIPKKKERPERNRPDTRGSTNSSLSNRSRVPRKQAWGARSQPVTPRKPRQRRSGSFVSMSSAASAYNPKQAKFLKEAYRSGFEAGLARSRSVSMRSESEYSYSRSRRSSIASYSSNNDDYDSYPSAPGSRISSRRSNNDSIHLSSVHPSDSK